MEQYRFKIMTLKQMEQIRNQLRTETKKVVFTNGCFDILHPGHARYLYSARELGDFLMVAVNSDASVRAIKGPSRPILGQDARTEMVAALGCVDGVIIFHEPDPKKVIQHLLPDILVKGGDWKEDQIIGADVVKQAGGKVIRIPFSEGFSTTDLINRIRSSIPDS